MRQNKKIIVLKMEFDLVDWKDDTYVPSYDEISSTLKVLSAYRQEPEGFTKSQTKIITKWLKENSIEKFLKAKQLAERHQAMLAEDNEISSDYRFFKRLNTNH